jgi:hypothetical protein
MTLHDEAKSLYAAYNDAGPPERAWLNYRGERCPDWADLTEVVRMKWLAVAVHARSLALNEEGER